MAAALRALGCGPTFLAGGTPLAAAGPVRAWWVLCGLQAHEVCGNPCLPGRGAGAKTTRAPDDPWGTCPLVMGAALGATATLAAALAAS